MNLKKFILVIFLRIREIYFRFFHAYEIFTKRFFTLAIKKRVKLEKNFRFNEDIATNRGNCDPEGRFYSKNNQIEWKDIPKSVGDLILDYDPVIRMYLGNGYLLREPMIWRNFHIPKQYQNTELFSQNWHYDRVYDFRNIQLFILLDDVSDDQGPLEYVIENEEKKLLNTVILRNNDPLNLKTTKLTGKRGDTLLFSTGSTPHRAGIPTKGCHRDIFSIAFFPCYSKIGKSPFDVLKSFK